MLTVLIRDAKSVVKGKINVAISNSKIEKRTIAWEKNDVQFRYQVPKIFIIRPIYLISDSRIQ